MKPKRLDKRPQAAATPATDSFVNRAPVIEFVVCGKKEGLTLSSIVRAVTKLEAEKQFARDTRGYTITKITGPGEPL